MRMRTFYDDIKVKFNIMKHLKKENVFAVVPKWCKNKN